MAKWRFLHAPDIYC